MPRKIRRKTPTQPLLLFPNIPSDILLDLLKFLDRNNLEKCQLVSQKWCDVIVQKSAILPLRKFDDLHVTLFQRTPFNLKLTLHNFEFTGIWHEIPIGNLPKTRKRKHDAERFDAMIRSIKFCHFNSVTMSPQLNYKHYDELFACFKRYNLTLHVTNMRYFFYPIDDFATLRMFNHFHETFVHCHLLCVTFDREESYTLISQIEIFEVLNFSNGTKNINIDLNYTSNENTLMQFVTSGKLQGTRRFTMDIDEGYLDLRYENFFEKFLEAFKTSSNPCEMIRQLTFYVHSSSALYTNILTFLTNRPCIKEEKTPGRYVSRSYRFPRSDRWSLEVNVSLLKDEREFLEPSKIILSLCTPEETKESEEKEKKAKENNKELEGFRRRLGLI